MKKKLFADKKEEVTIVVYDGKSSGPEFMQAVALPARVFEFDPEESIDIEGRDWETPVAFVTTKTPDMFRKMEMLIGAPYIHIGEAQEQICIKKIGETKKDSGYVKDRIAKMERLLNLKTKSLAKAFFKNTKTPEKECIGDIRWRLDTLFCIKKLIDSNEDGLLLDSIYKLLYRCIVARERDRLFYLRRHQETPEICTPTNAHILSTIDELRRFINRPDVFDHIPCSGKSTPSIA